VTEMSAADQLVVAVHTGDVDSLQRLLVADAGLAVRPLGGRHGRRTALHVVADWPGYFPNGPQIVGVLLAAGGNPNARVREGLPRRPCIGRPVAMMPTSPGP